MKNIITILLFLAATTLIACNAENNETALEKKLPLASIEQLEETDNDFSPDTTRGGMPQIVKQETGNAKSTTAPNIEWDKKIIRTAVLNAEVKDFHSYYTGLREKIKTLGGYIAEENQSSSDYKIENTIVIKVPVDQFDNAITHIATGAIKINEKRVSSQDVTGEVVDTRSRIEAKRQVKDRYMELLRQAKNMEEIIQVEKEIQGVQEQIEQGSGRVSYLSHSSSYSTIQFTYFQVIKPGAVVDNDPSFGNRLLTALKNGWSVVSNIFLGLVTIWPILLISFICYLVYKRLKIQKPNTA